ncbi:hypothetical protein [Chromobacterium haemolyticum]|nr:hypothetical protein [Chromobacterium haemolyticum]BBH11753.1 hypothetical protein CH06BL_10010 [Chromobacterium haemolyticum]
MKRELHFVCALLEVLKFGHERSCSWMVAEAMPQQAIIIWC